MLIRRVERPRLNDLNVVLVRRAVVDPALRMTEAPPGAVGVDVESDIRLRASCLWGPQVRVPDLAVDLAPYFEGKLGKEYRCVLVTCRSLHVVARDGLWLTRNGALACGAAPKLHPGVNNRRLGRQLGGLRGADVFAFPFVAGRAIVAPERPAHPAKE